VGWEVSPPAQGIPPGATRARAEHRPSLQPPGAEQLLALAQHPQEQFLLPVMGSCEASAPPQRGTGSARTPCLELPPPRAPSITPHSSLRGGPPGLCNGGASCLATGHGGVVSRPPGQSPPKPALGTLRGPGASPGAVAESLAPVPFPPDSEEEDGGRVSSRAPQRCHVRAAQRSPRA